MRGSPHPREEVLSITVAPPLGLEQSLSVCIQPLREGYRSTERVDVWGRRHRLTGLPCQLTTCLPYFVNPCFIFFFQLFRCIWGTRTIQAMYRAPIRGSLRCIRWTLTSTWLDNVAVCLLRCRYVYAVEEDNTRVRTFCTCIAGFTYTSRWYRDITSSRRVYAGHLACDVAND